MTKVRFCGRILPNSIRISVTDHPVLNWTNKETGLVAKFQTTIENSSLTIDFESNQSGDEHFQNALLKAIDLSQAVASLASFREAIGVIAILDSVEINGGDPQMLLAEGKAFKGLAAAVSEPQDAEKILQLMLKEPNLFLAIRDLSESIQNRHTAAINCARAVEAICTYFIPEGRDRDDGWPLMRDALNLGEGCVRSITKPSRGPRHGNRKTDSDTDLTPVGIRTWKVMNRFLEYRKRKDQPLPPSEFPILDD